MEHCNEAEATLTRLEVAVRHGHVRLALRLLGVLRDIEMARAVLPATVDCALAELDGSSDREDLERFVARVRAAFDLDAHQ